MAFCEKIYDAWMGETQRAKIKAILSRIKPAQPLLDLGSGPGYLEEFIPALAADINLEYLRKIRGARVRCDMNALPFRDNAFKTIFCIDVCHFLKNWDDLIRILKRGGKVVIALFNRRDEERVLSALSKLKLVDKFSLEQENELVLVFKKV
jgi:SAM-dependent methyltransferase